MPGGRLSGRIRRGIAATHTCRILGVAPGGVVRAAGARRGRTGPWASEEQRPPMTGACDVFLVKLDELQPSQLYINADKLTAVLSAIDGVVIPSAPLPVRRFGGRLVLTDGHTRAVAAHLRGVDELQATWDQDDLDWEAYEICVKWCLQEGVRTIGDLAPRVVSGHEYGRLWLGRCSAMHQALAARRASQREDVHRAP